MCHTVIFYDSGASLSVRAKQSARRRSKTYILLLLTNLASRRALLRRPSGIDAARRAASIGGTQNRSPGSLERRSGASTRNRLRDSLQVLGGPTCPILGRVCKGVQGCARVCKGCSSTAWPAPSSLSSAKCAQSDSASIGHVTGLSGYAALDLFEWASARSPTM